MVLDMNVNGYKNWGRPKKQMDCMKDDTARKQLSSDEERNIKTMFVSHEKNVGKKTFQKPNILRRKPKISVTRSNISNVNESPGTKSLVTGTYVDNTRIHNQHFEQIPLNEEYVKPTITQSVLKLSIANNNDEDNTVNRSQETDMDANVNSNATISSNIMHITNEDKSLEQNSLNIESFINGRASEEQFSLPIIDDPVSLEKKTTQNKTKWCFDFSNNMDIMIDNYNIPQLGDTEQKSDYIIDVVPSVIPTSVQQPSKQLHEVICSSTPTRTVSVELFSNRAVKFKCDEPNCNKGFWSEERLKKHKNSHNRQPAVRAPSQITIECPVKKVLSDGVEEKCPQTFQVRRELLKHLDADHTPEDALHRCEVCGRRFFWASGLRAHAQSVCARGGLACAWPGCGRVFRLPCRLREHARAHTGDRPYLCRYPECGWAFRSASKLVRHARRHTDERRHVCGACGRAFLRREHLRDHAARHHAPAKRPAHLCHHPGCEQTFTNMSTLYMHMKKVHRRDESETVTPAVTDGASAIDAGDNIYLVSVVDEEEPAAPAPDAATHAARTHCTWPLARPLAHEHEHEPAYVLEEDVHVENAEGSSSNVYTVRSDLFLHGNVPIDDDSQNIGGAEMTEGGEAAAPLDTDLCLIDSHPTIDLMQEELMYEDVAVDESPFRVFLMNGEELT